MSDDSACILTIDGANSEGWRVASLDVREELFSPTWIHIRAVTSDIVDVEALAGQDLTIELTLTFSEPRAFHGVVLEASEEAVREDCFVIEVVAASRMELLRLGRDHRIYQEMTVEDVVKDVLSRAGIDDVCQWSLNASYEPHLNIVQYGESDYDFVTRLLFEEGINYAVLQDDAAEEILFYDDDTAYEAIDGDSMISLQQSEAEATTHFPSLHIAYSVASDKVMQRDYDLERPAADLSTDAATPDTTEREVYLHPGSYVDSGRGQRLTDRWLERLRARTSVFSGASLEPRLAPARFFTVADAAFAGMDDDYLVTRVDHHLGSSGPEGDDFDYRNQFETIPVAVPWRAADAPSPPRIGGVQHAIVTVPGGEEIHADANGRSKVRFLWDRSGIMDDTSSTWLRVGQLALGGSMILPRIDFEVLVDFELGDLDRPAISGHLYNAELAPPYALPDGATISSMQTATTGGGPGANEIRYEDSAGGEEIFINASKDYNASIDDNMDYNVGNNQTCDVGSNQTLSVTAEHKSTVTGSRTLDVGANQDVNVGGDYGDGVGGSLTVSIGGNRMLKVGGDHSEDITTSYSRTVGSLQSLTGIAGLSRTVGGDATINVGAAWAELAGAARGLSITGSYTENVGALKFIKAKNVSVSCEAAYVMNAAAELVKAGGGRVDDAKGAVALTAGAAFNVKAKNIIFEAGSKLVFRGGGASITLTSAGMVTVKAPSITVENSEALNQIMHKSN